MSGYAMSASYSLVDDDENGVQAGFHLRSTDGINIDVQAEGDDREEVAKTVLSEIINQTLQQSLEAAEQPEEETTDGEPDSLETLQIENEQLRDEINYLRGLVAESNTTSSFYKTMINEHICDCKNDKGNRDSLEELLSAYNINMDFITKFFNI